MFSGRTIHGVHNAGNSSALRLAEEEFGSLKRQLERRERMRLGLAAPFDGAESATLGCKSSQQAVKAASSGGSMATDDAGTHLPTTVDANPHESPHDGTTPEACDAIVSVPLFATDAATLDVVRASHSKHNRVVLAHEVQWAKGKRIVEAMTATHEASRKSLEDVINTSKHIQSGDPATLDSGTCTSNYLPIRETMRCISSMGNQIDDSDQSHTDFSFLLSDATLSTRERVLLQRLREVSSRLKTATIAVTALKDKAQQDELEHDAHVHDLKEAQREAMQQAQETWQEEQTALTSDVEHWRESSRGLQSALDATKAQLEREREAAKQLLADTVAAHREEVAKWMQAVALGDREKHALSQHIKELERTLDGSSGAAKALAAELDECRHRYESLASTHSQLTASLRDTEALLSTTTGSLQLLQAQKPEMHTIEVQADTEAIIADMRGSLETLKKDNSRLRVDGDLLQKRLAACKAEVSGAELVKKQLSAMQLDYSASQSALADVSRRQRRDHDRRMALVCENFVLRASILVLQRPNGFGERMETLLTENRWLMTQLEKRTPLRIMTADTEQHDPSGMPSRLVTRHKDDAPTGVERDVVCCVREAGTQASTLGPASVGHTNGIGLWKSQVTQVDQAMLLEVEGMERVASLAQYVATSVAKQQLDARLGVSRTIALAATRFKRSISRAAPPACDDDGNEVDAAPEMGASSGCLVDDVHCVRAAVLAQQQHAAASSQVPHAAKGGLRPLSAASNASVRSTATTKTSGGFSTEGGGCGPSRPPRPQSAIRHAAMEDDEEADAVQPVSASGPPMGELFCVVGHRDTPQRSALTGNPSHYYAMMREQGLGGISGKRKELDLQQHLAMACDVTVEPVGCATTAGHSDGRKAGWAPTHYVPASTFPVRTMGGCDHAATGSCAQPQPRAQSASASRNRPRTNHPSPVTTLDGFMPATRGPIGSWRPGKAAPQGCPT